jgi:hypothetical protein
VALDKGQGEVRPVGIGEALRRLICKVISYAVQTELQEACGAMQLCAGLPSGCEAGANALQKIWEEPGTEAVIMVDARNAFNELNRAEALNATWEHCPIMGRALKNLYGHPSVLRMADGSKLMSEEGTTQGCPLGMAMYAVASIPLIRAVATEGVRQIWYADDSAGGGKVAQLKQWMAALQREGPSRGYHVKMSKTVALVKPGFEDEFRRVFGTLAETDSGGLKVVVALETESGGIKLGQRYLGVGIGSEAFRRAYVKTKIAAW